MVAVVVMFVAVVVGDVEEVFGNHRGIHERLLHGNRQKDVHIDCIAKTLSIGKASSLLSSSSRSRQLSGFYRLM